MRPREYEKTVSAVSLADNTQKLYWYLDEVYYGRTVDFHQMEMTPEEGKHTITVVNEEGQKKTITFNVFKRK